MFQKKNEPLIAQEERTELTERAVRVAPPGQKLILLGTALAAALLILFGIASKFNYFGVFGEAKPAHLADKAPPPPVSAPSIKVPLQLGNAAPVPNDATVCVGGLRLPPGMPCPQPQAAGQGQQASAGPPAKSAAERLRERRFKGDINVASTAAAADGAPAPVAAVPGQGGGLFGGAPAPANALSSALAATATPGTVASVNLNPSMTLAKGTLPDCTLNTAIRTSQPGFVKCTLSAPVYSMDGSVVLMERGTVLEGEYTQGLQAGQTAIFTLWSRAVTPNAVIVSLNSPGTDALGRAGSDGYIDNKFLERYAGAIFFSVLEDAKDVVIARSSDNGGGGSITLYPNSQNASKTLVEEMLKQGSQAKPDLYKNQGEIIKVFVARDVDFSSVYELRSASAR